MFYSPVLQDSLELFLTRIDSIPNHVNAPSTYEILLCRTEEHEYISFSAVTGLSTNFTILHRSGETLEVPLADIGLYRWNEKHILVRSVGDSSWDDVIDKDVLVDPTELTNKYYNRRTMDDDSGYWQTSSKMYQMTRPDSLLLIGRYIGKADPDYRDYPRREGNSIGDVIISQYDDVEAEPEYDLWTRILESDLSETVINPSKIGSDDISSWWSDEFIEEWTERGNELKDEWYDRLSAIGYRGENYTKFDIHFSSVTKTSSRKYNVKGLTRCEGVISQFSGFIVLDSLKVFEDCEEYSFLRAPYNVGKISAHYDFDVPTLGAKMFGKSTYDVLEIDDCIYYNAIMSIADGFNNNQYEGVWKDMVTNKLMKCNWGDCRIPDSCDLDIGAGEFAPAEEYINNGWQLLDGNHWEEYEEDCLWWQKYDQ